MRSYPILSYPILSYPILSYPVLSYPFLSYPILSYPFLFYSILCRSHFLQCTVHGMFRNLYLWGGDCGTSLFWGQISHHLFSSWWDGYRSCCLWQIATGRESAVGGGGGEGGNLYHFYGRKHRTHPYRTYRTYITWCWYTIHTCKKQKTYMDPVKKKIISKTCFISFALYSHFFKQQI